MKKYKKTKQIVDKTYKEYIDEIMEYLLMADEEILKFLWGKEKAKSFNKNKFANKLSDKISNSVDKYKKEINEEI